MNTLSFMLEQELQLERNLFLCLNGSDSVFWDHFFWIYSQVFTWIPLYLFFIFVVVYKQNYKEIIFTLVSVILVIVLTDQISSGFFKPFFHRLRPTHHPLFCNEVDTVFGYLGGKYGFISGHAANSFGFAIFSAFLFKNRIFTGTILIFAFVNAYSRIYLGLHFISDVVVGALVGTSIGYIVYRLYVFSRKRFLKLSERERKKPIYFPQEIYSLCSVYIFLVAIILIFNNQLVNIFH
jgi:undecaprenyl-diphosphatase